MMKIAQHFTLRKTSEVQPFNGITLKAIFLTHYSIKLFYDLLSLTLNLESLADCKESQN